MNLRQPTFFLIFFFLSIGIQAQNRANHWYFGRYAGIDFNSGTPVAVTDGVMTTREGCATISDINGTLLFYTDGTRVYHRNHGLMPNGQGLDGSFSSTHSAVVIPVPGSFTEYYIFTVDTLGGGKGFKYSIVNMALNGGLGDVTLKNIPLHSDAQEKIAAYKKTGSNEYWIMIQRHNSSSFMAYEVTSAGINPIPVESAVGSGSYEVHTGQIKFSTDGRRMAMANHDWVEVFDFNETTGQLSNFITLRPEEMTYGIEFSPDGRLLYSNYYKGICQYDLSAGSEDDIEASKVVLNAASATTGSLQLGPDGKIYGVRLNNGYLDVIHNPNSVGLACDYRLDDIYLNGRIGQLGLPTFISNISTLTGNISFENTCFGEQTDFTGAVQNPSATVLWDFGDGATSIDADPSHTYAAAGTYQVTLTVTEGARSSTESVALTISEVPVANPVADMEACVPSETMDYDLKSLDALILGPQDPSIFQVSYFDSQADADAQINPLPQQMVFDLGTNSVYARVSNGNNILCFDTTRIDIIVKQAPQLFVPTDWVVCDDDGDGAYLFDLTTKDSEVLNGQDDNIFDVSYYGSQLDADNGTNPLNTAHSVSVLDETVYYRIEHTAYPECFETGSFLVGVIDQVVAHQASDMGVCNLDNGGTTQFDLSLTEDEILGGQSASSVIISYHGSQVDADSNTDPLPVAYSSNSAQKTIYVRVTNANDASCYDTGSFQLNSYEVPVVPVVSDWQVCDSDNDGHYIFDLTEKATGILNNTSGTSIAFYESEANAEMEQNPISGNYQNTGNPQTIYFRLNNTQNTTCYATGSFDLEVFDAPTAYGPTDLVVCAMDETGINTIDLSQKDAEVLNGQDALSYEVSYHSSEVDALNGERSLDKENYSNTAMSEMIYARVQHRELVSCYDIIDFELTINPLPDPGLEEVYVICPDSPELVLDAGTFESYRWEDENGSLIGNGQTIDITHLGKYTLTVTETQNGLSCSNTVGFEVLSSGAPESFEVTTDGLSDRVTLTVDAVGTGDFEYSIDGRSYQSSNQFEVFPGKYTVFVRDLLGCRTISNEVIAIGYQKFFSPNGDGINEHWNIIGGELYPDAQLFLYDRYGKLLVQLSPQGQGWDGTILGRRMPSTDYWFKYVYDNGKTYAGHFSLRR